MTYICSLFALSDLLRTSAVTKSCRVVEFINLARHVHCGFRPALLWVAWGGPGRSSKYLPRTPYFGRQLQASCLLESSWFYQEKIVLSHLCRTVFRLYVVCSMFYVSMRNPSACSPSCMKASALKVLPTMFQLGQSNDLTRWIPGNWQECHYFAVKVERSWTNKHHQNDGNSVSREKLWSYLGVSDNNSTHYRICKNEGFFFSAGAVEA